MLVGKIASKTPTFKINGSYLLENYDDNLESWLDSLSINGAKLGPVFRTTKVKIVVQQPSKFNKKWIFTHKVEGQQHFSVQTHAVVPLPLHCM